MKKVPSTMFLFELIFRYILGLIMAGYGLIKILNIQFLLPSHVYGVALKDLDGVTLTWAFLGYSSWFSTLLGFFELIPALLLMFSRTRLVGAILLFPSLLTIFLINNAYDFLPQMKIFTGILLLMNLTLVFNHFQLLIKIFNMVLQDTSKNKKLEFLINFLLIAVVSFIILKYLK